MYSTFRYLPTWDKQSSTEQSTLSSEYHGKYISKSYHHEKYYTYAEIYNHRQKLNKNILKQTKIKYISNLKNILMKNDPKSLHLITIKNHISQLPSDES